MKETLIFSAHIEADNVVRIAQQLTPMWWERVLLCRRPDVRTYLAHKKFAVDVRTGIKAHGALLDRLVAFAWATLVQQEYAAELQRITVTNGTLGTVERVDNDETGEE